MANNKKNQDHGTRLAEKLGARMREKDLSIRDVAETVGSTYEHVRNIVNGGGLPSRRLLKDLSEALSLNHKELVEIRTSDEILKKHGGIPLLLAHKNPELEPIERVWANLSKQHKKDLMTMAEAFARQDTQVNA